MSQIFSKGDDSGAPPETVKRQLFVDQLGICAEPTCMGRIMQDGTLLAECAHIIPRRVDSHPREDWITPLEDRKKEPNLLYLCRTHHDLVDDPKHAQRYTAATLRGWKTNHAAWVSRLGKTGTSTYLPPQFSDMLAGIQKQFADQLNLSSEIIQDLLQTCRDFLDRNLLNEAALFLHQLDHHLLNAGNEHLSTRADFLGALLLIRNAQIPEAKERLRQIIQNHPHYLDALLEYVELCATIPEPNDNVEEIEHLARTLAGEHPRLSFIDLIRKFQREEHIEIPDISEVWANDVRLNAKFICQYVLVCDFTQRLAERDALINRWEQELPTSPRPHLFRALFRFSDLARSTVVEPSELSRSVKEATEYIHKERSSATDKDPLSLSDQISWLMLEVKLVLAYDNVANADSETSLTEFASAFFALVERYYFDHFIDNTLLEFLSFLRINIEQWQLTIRKIYESKVLPSQPLVELLFLQALRFSDLYSELDEFINKYKRDDLNGILHSIIARDTEAAAGKINAKEDSAFSLYILASVPDAEFCLALTELLHVDEASRNDLLYARFRYLVATSKEKEALAIAAALPLDNAASSALRTIERITARQRRWHMFVPVALQLLDYDLTPAYRIQLNSLLAMGHFEQGDDSNAIRYADQALERVDLLGDDDAQILLSMVGRAFTRKGQYDEACAMFQKYEHIKRSSPLLLEEAHLYLRSHLPNKYEHALELLLRAFEGDDHPDDQLYLQALSILLDLTNNGKIPYESEPAVNDGYFIRLDGFSNRWFYIGDSGSSLGNERLRSNMDTYKAVIHRELADEIEWPPDRFTRPDSTRKIIRIVAKPAFIADRAHEIMIQKGEAGNASIWPVQVIETEGEFDFTNLKRFYEEQLRSDNDFLESYVSAPMPFSLLCAYEGSLPRALGKLTSERSGFIHINNGSLEDMSAQLENAGAVQGGSACYIDGLSAFMLTEAGLLEQVIKALPSLGVATSVVKLLREIAMDYEGISGSPGRLGYVDGNLHFTPRDEVKEEAIRQYLLSCANLLDNLPNKVIAKTYPELDGERNLDSIFPDYAVDAFHYAQEQNVYLITDDWYLGEAYKSQEEILIPKRCSSYSLIRAMAEKKLIAWDAYFQYYERLCFYRYRLLPISVDDLITAAFPPSVFGLITSAPRNIQRLNLQFTLSQEYGVDDRTVLGIMSNFFTRLILDAKVPAEIADKIFAQTITYGLSSRDKRQMARIIIRACQQNLRNGSWVNQSSEAKLNSLDRLLFGFVQGIDLI